MPDSSRPSPRKQPQEGSSSRLPAIIVNPSHNADEEVYEGTPGLSGRRLSDAERIASFLEALAGTIRDDVERRGRTSTTGSSAPNQSATGLGAAPPSVSYGPDPDGGADTMTSAMLYHLMRALRNLNHFVFITPGPRGLLFIVHIPRKVLVAILFALFLMFASVYRLPEVWEILFGIFGII